MRYINLVLALFEPFKSDRSTAFHECNVNLQQFQWPTSSTKPIDDHWLKHCWNSPREERTGWLWYWSIATESTKLKIKIKMTYIPQTHHEIYQGDYWHWLSLYDQNDKCCGPRRGAGIPKYIRPFQKTLGPLIRYDTKQRTCTSVANEIADQPGQFQKHQMSGTYPNHNHTVAE